MKLNKILEEISKIKFLTAFNANIDAIKFLTKAEILNFLKEININKIDFNKLPTTINSKEDFVSGLLYSIKHSKGIEIPLKNEKMNEWFDKIVFDVQKIGGQAGIVADLFSSLGIKVIFYTNPLSKKLVRFFKKPSNILFPVVNKEIRFVEISNASVIEKTKINRIFEIPKGISIKIKNEKLETKKQVRFIVSSRPEEIRICFDESLRKFISELSKKINGFFVSGFHGIKEKYSDGKTFDYYLNINTQSLQKMKNANKKLRIHFELVSIPNKERRKKIVEKIFPVVDFVGMDDVELNQVYELYFESHINENDIKSVLDFLVFLIEKFKLKGIQLHTYYYMVFVTKENVEKNEIENALNFGNLLAVTRAVFGDVSSLEEIEKVEKVIKPNNIGLKIKEKIEKLSKNFKDYLITSFPTRIVVNPRITVGLGDSLSSGIFVYLLSKLKEE